MLMMIGPVRLKVAPFNMTDYTHTHGANFAEKPVMGARPPLEYTGGAPESWSLKANLFPQRFGGGGALAQLTVMRASGLPYFVIRGDGAVLGWSVIDSVVERSSRLARNGVGQIIDVDISLRRSSAPSPGGFFAAMSGLFAGVLR